MKRTIACAGCLAIAVGTFFIPGTTLSAEEKPLLFRIHAVADRFIWEEKADGVRLLREDGALGGLGAEVSVRFPRGFRLDLGGSVYGGGTDYDGTTQEGAPARTTVDYTGGRGQALLAVDVLPPPEISLGPCFTVGARGWTRDINDSPEGYGYEEDWLTVYCGGGVELSLGKREIFRWFGRAVVRYPLYNNASYDLSRLGYSSDIDAEPGRRATVRAEAGINVNFFQASLHYETLSFGRSDDVLVGDGVVYQPKSEGSLFGIDLGFVF